MPGETVHAIRRKNGKGGMSGIIFSNFYVLKKEKESDKIKNRTNVRVSKNQEGRMPDA